MTAAVGEAGRVVVPPEIARDQNLTLRLLHAGSYLEEGHSRWELSRRAKVRDVGVVLRHKGKEVPPDLQVSLTDRAYAVWYELAPGRGVIQAETADGLLRPKELKLVAGKIERLFEIMEATSV